MRTSASASVRAACPLMRLMPDEYHWATLLHPFNSPRKEELEEQENLPRLHSAAEAVFFFSRPGTKIASRAAVIGVFH